MKPMLLTKGILTEYKRLKDNTDFCIKNYVLVSFTYKFPDEFINAKGNDFRDGIILAEDVSTEDFLEVFPNYNVFECPEGNVWFRMASK